MIINNFGSKVHNLNRANALPLTVRAFNVSYRVRKKEGTKGGPLKTILT